MAPRDFQAISKLPRAANGMVVALLLGDLVAFLVFAAIGRRSHGVAAGFGAVLEVASTATPFFAGWLLVAPWLGAYRRGATASLLVMLRTTSIAWLFALPIGLLLRAAMIGRFSPLSFAIVTFLTNLVLLGSWRGLFAWLTNRNKATALTD